MNWELICWLVAGFILSEALYIFWLPYDLKIHKDFKNKKRKVDSCCNGNWCGIKILSYIFIGIFLLIQWGITAIGSEYFSLHTYGSGLRDLVYTNLIWEFSIIIFVSLVIYVNYLIFKRIKKKTLK